MVSGELGGTARAEKAQQARFMRRTFVDAVTDGDTLLEQTSGPAGSSADFLPAERTAKNTSIFVMRDSQSGVIKLRRANRA